MKFTSNSFLRTFVWVLSLVLIMTFVLSADIMAGKDKKKGSGSGSFDDVDGKYRDIEDLTDKQKSALTKIWTSKKAKE